MMMMMSRSRMSRTKVRSLRDSPNPQLKKVLRRCKLNKLYKRRRMNKNKNKCTKLKRVKKRSRSKDTSKTSLSALIITKR